MNLSTQFLLIFNIFWSSISHSQTIPERPNNLDGDGTKQGDWVYYYDADWNTVKTSTNAEFYRLITYANGKPTGPVIDYFRNGQIQMSIDSIIIEDPFQYDGMMTEFSKEGNIVLLEYRRNGRMDTTYVIHRFRQLIENYQKKIPDHLDLAYTANNLAYLFLAQKRYDSAEIYYRIAQEIREKVLDPNDVIYANSCNKLGYVLLQQGKLMEAEPFYKTSLKVHGEILGKNSDYYEGARSNLAYIYTKTKRFNLAEPLYMEAAQGRLNSFGKDDKYFKSYNYKLAQVYANLNQWNKALDSYLLSNELSGDSKVDMLWFVELLEK